MAAFFHKKELDLKSMRLVILAITFAFTGILFGQNPIPNNQFEQWDLKTTTVLKNWKTMGSVTKDTSLKNKRAVTLKNDTGLKIISTMAQIGSGYPRNYNGGMAINGTPTTVTVKYHSDLLNADTAYLLVGCTKTGDTTPIILEQFFLLPGQGSLTNEATSTFTLTYIHPTAGLIADSCFVYVTSSLKAGKPNSSGSITISDIAFSAATNSNLDFEGWNTLSIESPKNWFSSFSEYSDRTNKLSLSTGLSQKSGGYSGNGLYLQSVIINKINGKDTIPAWVATNNGLTPYGDVGVPAFPVSKQYGAISGFWKGQLVNGDRFTLMVNFFAGDTIVGSAVFGRNGLSLNQSSFVQFKENIVWHPNFTGVPEFASIGVWLTDSNMAINSNPNSKIWVDNLNLDQWGVQVKPIQKQSHLFTVAPNPSTDGIVRILNPANQPIQHVAIIGTQGNIVHSQSPNSETSIIEIPKVLSSGIYWISIRSNSGIETVPVVVR